MLSTQFKTRLKMFVTEKQVGIIKSNTMKILLLKGFSMKEDGCIRIIDSTVVSIVYNGKVWQDFPTHQGQSLLSQPNNYASMINVDWFQLFKHRRDYSVGVIYLVF